MSADRALPVTVVGGYLGAGKTTLINRLLRHRDAMRLAVLVNDFGDIDIDGDLIESADDQVMRLAGGCVCCSIGSDLVVALSELARRSDRFDHVLLETSGVAMPGVVAATVTLAPGVCRAGVIVLVDALNGERGLDDPYFADTHSRQIAAADLLLISKTDLVSQDTLARLRTRLDGIAPGVAQTDAGDSLSTSMLLGPDLARAAAFADNDEGFIADPRRERHFKPLVGRTDGFLSQTFKALGPVDVIALQRTLSAPDSNVLRAKGVIGSPDGALWLVQTVGESTSVSPFHGDRTNIIGRLVVISSGRAPPGPALVTGLAALGLQR